MKSEDLLPFCDCISLIRNAHGLVAWGDDDLFLFCGEGVTAFYTSTAETADAAIEILKDKVQYPQHDARVFLIMVGPNDKLLNDVLEQASIALGLQDTLKYVQLFLREENKAAASVMTPNGKFSYEKLDVDFANSCVTVYLLVNEGCNITHEDLYGQAMT